MKTIEVENIKLNNPCEAPLISPASWCKKSESKGAEVPPADFLLEAEKRGTPPKSEKAAAFWETRLNVVGGSGNRGVQPFLREEKNSEIAESVKKQSVDCHADSANLLAMTDFNGLQCRFCESARNDSVCERRARDKRAVLARSAFGMIFAVILVIIIAGLGILGLKFSNQTLSTTTNEYIAIQLDLYMNSTTEIAILYVQRNGFVCNEGVDCDLGPNNISGQKLGVGKREPRDAITKYIEYGDSGEYKFTFKITPLDNYDKYNTNEYMQIDDIVDCENSRAQNPTNTQRCFREDTKNIFLLDIAGSVTNPLTNQTLRVTKRQVIKP